MPPRPAPLPEPARHLGRGDSPCGADGDAAAGNTRARRRVLAGLLGWAAAPWGLHAAPVQAQTQIQSPAQGGAGAAETGSTGLPLFDAHIHYSHDAVDLVPPAQAVALLRQASLRGALVSSSDDRGTQLLAAAAPELIVPSLRPYRSRGELGRWMHDPATLRYIDELAARHRYAAVGEFHLFGADADLPVPRHMVGLARRHGWVLHAHSDADAVERLLRQWPEARVLWAHSGFEPPEAVRALLQRHPRLWCDLAFRGDHAPGGQLDPAWRATFEAWPDRFMVGTDTFTPERWHFIPLHAAQSRQWLNALPQRLAEGIAWRNAHALLQGPARA